MKNILLEIKGDHNLENKKLAIRKALAKKKVKCPDGMTPQISPSSTPSNPKFICKPKDKQKARMMKKIIKKLKLDPKLMKAKVKKALDTKKFRGEI